MIRTTKILNFYWFLTLLEVGVHKLVTMLTKGHRFEVPNFNPTFTPNEMKM
jgi:hypothetical protein